MTLDVFRLSRSVHALVAAHVGENGQLHLEAARPAGGEGFVARDLLLATSGQMKNPSRTRLRPPSRR